MIRYDYNIITGVSYWNEPTRAERRKMQRQELKQSIQSLERSAEHLTMAAKKFGVAIWKVKLKP